MGRYEKLVIPKDGVKVGQRLLTGQGEVSRTKMKQVKSTTIFVTTCQETHTLHTHTNK